MKDKIKREKIDCTLRIIFMTFCVSLVAFTLPRDVAMETCTWKTVLLICDGILLLYPILYCIEFMLKYLMLKDKIKQYQLLVDGMTQLYNEEQEKNKKLEKELEIRRAKE